MRRTFSVQNLSPLTRKLLHSTYVPRGQVERALPKLNAEHPAGTAGDGPADYPAFHLRLPARRNTPDEDATLGSGIVLPATARRDSGVENNGSANPSGRNG